MTRRDLVKTSGLFAAAAGAMQHAAIDTHGAGSDRPPARPNLLYILADQLGAMHCGYAGAGKARTPNIDRLSREGVSFGNAISTMPVCAAYRASLFTGKYPTSTGMVINELRMNTNHRCLGHVLTEAGYRTGYVGKWHLYANQLGRHHDPKNSHIPPGPNRLGFDGYWAAYNFHHEYYGAYYHTDSPEKISYGEGVYEPDGQTDLMIRFLRESAQAGQPFAAFLSYGTPHDPWSDNNVPAEYRALFEGVAFPHPPNYKAENDPRSDAHDRQNPGQRLRLEQWRRNYYAMTANLDWNVGRLLEALRQAGLADNTLVVFTSDHGEMFGAHGRWQKNIFYEEAARIPFLMRLPGRIPQGAVSDACLGTPDIMPTLLSLLGLDAPAEVEGTDLSHRALGKAGPEPEAAFMQNTGACADWRDGYEWRGLRDKRHTYAIYRSDRAELLFDNQADPWQLRNIAGDAAQQATMERFREMLKKRMAGLNDTFEACTWYREHWIKDRVILRGAKG